MLTGKNVVIVKNEDKTLTVQPYDRIYLEFSASDTLETYGKTVDGSDLKVDGKIWEGTRPKETLTADKSPEAIAKLVQEALNHFNSLEAAKLAADPKYVVVDGWLILLEAASYGADLWTRNKLQASIRPSKPITVEAANQAMAKKMVASGQAKTIEGALKKLALMASMSEE